MTDAVEPTWQDMEQEAADELVGGKRHGALALDTIAAIVLVAEGDSSLVEGDQTAVRDGDPVSVDGVFGLRPFFNGDAGRCCASS